MNFVSTSVRSILTNIWQAGVADGMGEELDHDKEWHLERAEQQVEDFYRNKIPKKVNAEMPNATTVAYNRAIDDITAQFNKGDSDE